VAFCGAINRGEQLRLLGGLPMALQVGHQDDRCSVPSGHRGHALRTRERLPPGPERRRPSEATAGRARVDGEGTVPAQPVAVPQVSIARDRWDDRSRWLTRRLPDGPRQPQAVSPLPTPNPSQPSRFCIISTYTVTYGGTPLCICYRRLKISHLGRTKMSHPAPRSSPGA